ncbi:MULTISPECIES: NUDIX hydrolase [unclassified Rhizobium]|uniref:NUDIX hydrolase n=1 Tax=unclassified Rhizobium TaxID=2613769 RepID=UPI000AAEBB9E|nr:MULTISPECIES: NUDIX hydrolase [unclassified Rhizobium]
MALYSSETPAFNWQAGAICYRRNIQAGEMEVLLIGSLRTGLWGIPKGHIESGETARETAEREAFEEAGISGLIEKDALGTFTYAKETSPNRFHVTVHLLRVLSRSDDFPEDRIRKSKWVPVEMAMREAGHPELSDLFARLLKQSECPVH